MSSRSRSTLFLLEQLLVVLIFALCAAACVKIFVSAYTTAEDAREMSQALLVAKSGAECYKASAGDGDRIAKALGGDVSHNNGVDHVVVYYDEEWQVCTIEQAAYALRLAMDGSWDHPALMNGRLSVETIGEHELIAFAVAARRAAQ